MGLIKAVTSSVSSGFGDQFKEFIKEELSNTEMETKILAKE